MDRCVYVVCLYVCLHACLHICMCVPAIACWQVRAPQSPLHELRWIYVELGASAAFPGEPIMASVEQLMKVATKVRLGALALELPCDASASLTRAQDQSLLWPQCPPALLKRLQAGARNPPLPAEWSVDMVEKEITRLQSKLEVSTPGKPKHHAHLCRVQALAQKAPPLDGKDHHLSVRKEVQAYRGVALVSPLALAFVH